MAPSPARQAPTNLKDRLIQIFEDKVLPFFDKLQLIYELKCVLVGLFGVFVFMNLMISVQPLLDQGRAGVIKEVKRRAAFMAKDIADRNSAAVAARAENKMDIGSASNADGVRAALLMDMELRVMAPASRMNAYLTTGVEATRAARARDRFRAGEKEDIILQEPNETTVLAIEPVKIFDPLKGKNIVAAMALVSIDTTQSTLDIGEIGVIYSEILIYLIIAGGLVALVIYRVTLRPFQALSDDLDKALKGELPMVTHEYKLEELNPLWDLINSAIQRLPRSTGAGGSDLLLIDEFVSPVRTFSTYSSAGVVLCDSAKKIVFVSPMFEEMTGIRADGAVGQDFAAIARDQSLGPFTEDLMNRSAEGETVQDDYEFSGISYKFHSSVIGLAGKEVRGYLLALVKVE